MNIIITRPLIDIDNLMTDFFKTDHKVYYIPTLKIESKKIDLIKYEDFEITKGPLTLNVFVWVPLQKKLLDRVDLLIPFHQVATLQL